jgi:hypothetical protein
MILLKDLFTMLSTGEFSNIALSRSATGTLNESEYEKVIGHINLGLVEIYKRFRFLENEMNLHVRPEVTTYYLRPERVVSLENITESKYLERPGDYEGFLNILEITGIFDESGNELVMNNRFSTPAIRQLAVDTLKITGLTASAIYSVVYQAAPSKIVLDDEFDPDQYQLPIPDTIIEALLYFIAHRVYKPMGANNSTANADKSAGYQQQYELCCQKLEMYGLAPQNDDRENKFEEEGWA